MKTREQMLAEGWTELWGYYTPKTDTWLRCADGIRYDGGADPMLTMKHCTPGEVPRRFWRRKKPRTFKAGDEVTLRATVTDGPGRDGEFRVVVEGGVGFNFAAYVAPSHLARVAKRKAKP